MVGRDGWKRQGRGGEGLGSEDGRWCESEVHMNLPEDSHRIFVNNNGFSKYIVII